MQVLGDPETKRALVETETESCCCARKTGHIDWYIGNKAVRAGYPSQRLGISAIKSFAGGRKDLIKSGKFGLTRNGRLEAGVDLLDLLRGLDGEIRELGLYRQEAVWKSQWLL